MAPTLPSTSMGNTLLATTTTRSKVARSVSILRSPARAETLVTSPSIPCSEQEGRQAWAPTSAGGSKYKGGGRAVGCRHPDRGYRASELRHVRQPLRGAKLVQPDATS